MYAVAFAKQLNSQFIIILSMSSILMQSMFCWPNSDVIWVASGTEDYEIWL